MAANTMCSNQLIIEKSNYFRSLTADVAKRYEDKIRLLNGRDPYTIRDDEWSTEANDLPDVGYRDLINYLVFGKSAYTSEDFKAYKSLTAFNQFASGWVKDVKAKKFSQHMLIIGKVLHSQKTKETPLSPWIIAEGNGTIVSAHCNCMAGLGEACTHVSAVLFYVEAVQQHRRTRTVTDVPAYWLVPSSKDAPSARLKEINFLRPKRRCLETSSSSNVQQAPSSEDPFTKQSCEEFLALVKEINSNEPLASILSVVPPFSKKFVPKANNSMNLLCLHSQSNESLGLEELVALGANLNLEVSQEEARRIEEMTRQQARSKSWFKFRSGRITASNFKSACFVKSTTSSPSLVKNICYPKAGFKSIATEWGCSHETVALKSYLDRMVVKHTNFKVSNTGFLINTAFPHLGATPDAIASCDCCGKGCVEVKCPYSLKECSILDVNKTVPYLLLGQDGIQYLDRSHTYFYQVQLQILVSGLPHCDFVVWTPKGEPHIERVFRDDLLEREVPKATSFFRGAVLPELLGKYFTRKCEVSSSVTSSENVDDGTWCDCNEVKGGKMVECCKEGCKILWFHLKCVGLKRVPKGNWFCHNCKT